MRKTRALELLFPGRAAAAPPPRSPLQAALIGCLAQLTATPELQAAGIAPYLTVLERSLTTMPDEQIRAGREMLRALVEVLDAADQPGADPAAQ